MIDDQDLRRALGRREPPAGFAERTLARLRARGANAPRPQPKPSWRWLAAGLAASLVLAAGISEVVVQRRDVQARKSAEDLTIALRITSEKLNEVQARLGHRQRVEQGVERDNVERTR
jgi:hypothetical protein